MILLMDAYSSPTPNKFNELDLWNLHTLLWYGLPTCDMHSSTSVYLFSSLCIILRCHFSLLKYHVCSTMCSHFCFAFLWFGHNNLSFWSRTWFITIPDSKVHGANMGPIWGRQDPGGPHVGPMNLAIRNFCPQAAIWSIVSVSGMKESWPPLQYPIRRPIVRSREVSKPRDWPFELSYLFEIWQAQITQFLEMPFMYGTFNIVH